MNNYYLICKDCKEALLVSNGVPMDGNLIATQEALGCFMYFHCGHNLIVKDENYVHDWGCTEYDNEDMKQRAEDWFGPDEETITPLAQTGRVDVAFD